MTTQVKRTPPENVSVPEKKGVHVSVSYVIDRPRTDLYRFWRNLENLPMFMEHLESVKMTNGTHSHWVAKAPLGSTVEWNATIINEIPNERLGWRSVHNSTIANAGSINFSDAPNGTLIRVEMEYVPPLGKVGETIATLLGWNATQLIEKDLLRFKELVESGTIKIPDANVRYQPTKNGLL